MSDSVATIAGLIALLAVAAAMVAVLEPRFRPGGVLADRRVLGVAVACAAIGGLFASGHPTGTTLVDPLLRAAFAGTIAAAGAVAPPEGLLVAIGAAAFGTSGGPWQWPSAGGLGAALGLALRGRHESVLGALIGGVAAQGLLRMSFPEQSGGTAVLAALVALVVVARPLAELAPRARRRALLGAMLGIVAVVVVAGVYAATVSSSRRALERAVAASQGALSNFRSGNSSAATTQFSIAANEFASSHVRLTQWWTRPGLAVPVLAQQIRALDELSRMGEEISRVGSTAASKAGEIRMERGAIDTASIAALVPSLDEATRLVADAGPRLERIHSPWLASLIRDRLDPLEQKLADASTAIATVDDAAHVAPAMLGANGVRTYFVALETPAELRGAGGVIGNYAIVTADHGRISLTRQGRIHDLNAVSASGAPAPRQLSGPPDYTMRYGHLVRFFFQDAMLSPDFPSDAAVMEELLPQAGIDHVDGVIAMDPVAIAGLLKISGALVVPEWPAPVTDANAVQILGHDQYVQIPDQELRIKFLAAVVQGMFDRLGTISVRDLSTVTRALGPLASSKHLMLQSTLPAEESLLDRTGVAGQLPPVRGDFLAVVNLNLGADKLDWYLRRTISDQVQFDPATGRTATHVEVRLTNTAPAAGLPPADFSGNRGDLPDDPPKPLGEMAEQLELYSPLQLGDVSIDGHPAVVTSAVERNRFVYAVYVVIPPGATVVVDEDLVGTLPAGQYHLDVSSQPLFVPDAANLQVAAYGRWSVLALRGFRLSGVNAELSLASLNTVTADVLFGRR